MTNKEIIRWLGDKTKVEIIKIIEDYNDNSDGDGLFEYLEDITIKKENVKNEIRSMDIKELRCFIEYLFERKEDPDQEGIMEIYDDYKERWKK